MIDATMPVRCKLCDTPGWMEIVDAMMDQNLTVNAITERCKTIPIPVSYGTVDKHVTHRLEHRRAAAGKPSKPAPEDEEVAVVEISGPQDVEPELLKAFSQGLTDLKGQVMKPGEVVALGKVLLEAQSKRKDQVIDMAKLFFKNQKPATHDGNPGPGGKTDAGTPRSNDVRAPVSRPKELAGAVPAAVPEVWGAPGAHREHLT